MAPNFSTGKFNIYIETQQQFKALNLREPHKILVP